MNVAEVIEDDEEFQTFLEELNYSHVIFHPKVAARLKEQRDKLIEENI